MSFSNELILQINLLTINSIDENLEKEEESTKEIKKINDIRIIV